MRGLVLLLLTAAQLAMAFDPEALTESTLLQGGSGAGDEQVRVVIDDNDFEKIRDLSRNDTAVKLGKKVAFLRMEDSCCSGFLVGPDLLLTNGHCIDRDVETPNLESHLQTSIGVEVYMEYYQDRWPGPLAATAVEVVDFQPWRGGYFDEYGGLDYALLRLGRPIGNDYGWLGIDPMPPVIGRGVMDIAHSKCRSKEVARRDSNTQYMHQGHFITYRVDTEGGSSGSPVFYRDGDGRVFSLNHAETPVEQLNQGVAMSSIYPRIAQWLPGTVNWQRLHRIARARTEYNEPLGQNARRYQLRESLQVELDGESGYYTIIAADSEGNVNVLWPNKLHKKTRLEGPVTWPAADMPFTINAAGPPGLQMIVTLVTDEVLVPIDQLLEGDEVFASLEEPDIAQLEQALKDLRYSARINYAEVTE